MQITDDTVVLFHYELSEQQPEDESNLTRLESSKENEPMAYLHGHKNLLPILEDAMAGKSKGDKLQVQVPPEKGYGPIKPEMQQRVPIKHLMTKGKLQPGMLVKINTDKGVIDARVIKVGRFNADLDTNHPLAGKQLFFDIEIVDVRAATAEEITHGHAHGPGGHHH